MCDRNKRSKMSERIGADTVCVGLGVQPNGKFEMQKLAICTTAALALSTSLALAQGSGASGDIGSGSTRTAPPPAAMEQQGTVGQGSRPMAPTPKAEKKIEKTDKKKSSPAEH
jgi:hypothetical protein